MKKPNVFTLIVVVAIFAAVLRLTDLTGLSTPASVAQDTVPEKAFAPVEGAEEKAPEKKPEEKKAEVPVPPPTFGERAFSPSEVNVLQSLATRRDELDKREQQMGQREALLKAAETEVDRKIAEMNKLKKELEDLLNKQQKVQGERVDSLVKIYEGMKPKEAARIFDTLDMDILMAVIGRMSERKSSPILAGMDPMKARAVTMKLVEQHKLPSDPPPPAPAPKKPAVPTDLSGLESGSPPPPPLPAQ